MKLPKPKDYEFIWLVENQDFLFTSIWINFEYPKYGFLFTFKGREHKAYLKKSERKKLESMGYKLYTSHYKKYKNKANRVFKDTKNCFRVLNRNKLKEYSNKQLARTFLKLIKQIQRLWSVYFFTEYFCLGKIEEEIKNKRLKSKLLRKRVYETQGFKFKIRKILNRTWYKRKDNVLNPFYKEIKKRLRLNRIENYHFNELVSLLKGEKMKVKNRRICVWGKFNNWNSIEGPRAKNLVNQFNKYFSKKRMLSGQVANPGFYVGKVKIVPFDLKGDMNKEISKMKEGDVLVSGSTGPEMILACQKAGAIVTEEGGITSHAATVSRELKIPCIIGTKVATQILKDGDKIEVDANKGIIKKL